MEAKAKTVMTPVGKFPFPMNPAFKEDLASCKTDEDLFELVEFHGFINPDAFTEVCARGLYGKYQEWKKRKKMGIIERVLREEVERIEKRLNEIEKLLKETELAGLAAVKEEIRQLFNNHKGAERRSEWFISKLDELMEKEKKLTLKIKNTDVSKLIEEKARLKNEVVELKNEINNRKHG